MTPDRDAFGNEVAAGAPPSWTPTPTPTHQVTPPAAPSGLPAPPAMTGRVARSGMTTGPATTSGATWALIVGLIGLWFWPISPVAWMMGKRAVAEIDASRGTLGGRGIAQAGRVLGIIGTLLLIVIGSLAALGFILEATGH